MLDFSGFLFLKESFSTNNKFIEQSVILLSQALLCQSLMQMGQLRHFYKLFISMITKRTSIPSPWNSLRETYQTWGENTQINHTILQLKNEKYV